MKKSLLSIVLLLIFPLLKSKSPDDINNLKVPDYVFDSEYNLPGLIETEKLILKHKYLPEKPPAIEIEKKGIGLGDMNRLLLKNIEGLTLYQIELLKRVKDLERRLEANKFQ